MPPFSCTVSLQSPPILTVLSDSIFPLFCMGYVLFLVSCLLCQRLRVSSHPPSVSAYIPVCCFFSLIASLYIMKKPTHKARTCMHIVHAYVRVRGSIATGFADKYFRRLSLCSQSHPYHVLHTVKSDLNSHLIITT